MARRKRGTPEQQARRALISELLSAANVQSMDDIQNLFKETIAEFMEGSLESELDEELGYEPYDVKSKTTDNSRNGHSKKTLKTSTVTPRISTLGCLAASIRADASSAPVSVSIMNFLCSWLE